MSEDKILKIDTCDDCPNRVPYNNNWTCRLSNYSIIFSNVKIPKWCPLDNNQNQSAIDIIKNKIEEYGVKILKCDANQQFYVDCNEVLIELIEQIVGENK